MSQREILFKAKRTDNGEWVEGFPYYGDYSGAFILQNKPVKRRNARTGEITLGDEVFPIEVDGRTYCQYTGLNDRNGEKIFEGDVFRVVTGCRTTEDVVVEWNEECAGFFPFSDYDKECGIYTNASDGFVFGNIHDN